MKSLITEAICDFERVAFDNQEKSNTHNDRPKRFHFQDLVNEPYHQLGVVIGTLKGFQKGVPLVDFKGNPSEDYQIAHSCITLSPNHLERELVLCFEENNHLKPIIIGLIEKKTETPQQELDVKIIGDKLELNSNKEIVIRCGEASITLTQAGKIIVRGNYIVSRSSGVNRIKGASVQIN